MAGGGKKEKGEGLGRALIRKRNKAAATDKVRGESVIDVDTVLQRAAGADQLAEAASFSSDSDLTMELDATGDTEEDRRRLRKEQETVLQRAAEGDQLAEAPSFSSDSDLVMNLDETGHTEEDRWRLRKEQETLHASSLRVPRRPPSHSQMTIEALDVELDTKERAFLVWCQNLARLEQNDKLVLTSFEKDFEIWIQLWRVLEQSDLLVMVVDARDPLFYRCRDLEKCTVSVKL